MGLLNPAALWLGTLGVPIVLLYLLKLRRSTRTVSSVMLWQRALRDQRANAPWQRLRRNLLLLLQLLILALLVLALARPYSEGPRQVRGNQVVLLDASASMQATDASPTRFEAARSRVDELIGALEGSDTLTIISVADLPRVLSPATGDRGTLRRALAEAKVSVTEADWGAAFALAASTAEQTAHPTIVIVSDGGLPPTLPPLPGEVHYIPIGQEAGNQGITALAVRDAPQSTQAFLRILNAEPKPATALVEVHVDGALFDARSVPIPASGEGTVTLHDLPPTAERVEGRLAGADRLSLDDVAWAVRPSRRRATAIVATRGNVFLERAIGLLPYLNPVFVPATDTLALDEAVQTTLSPTLYVLDGVVPDRLPEMGNLLFIDPPASTELFSLCGRVSRPQVTDVARTDPLLVHVDLYEMRVAQARCIEMPSWARRLVMAGDRPLLFAGEVGGRRVAVIAFDLHDTDLPLQVAFPILMSNLVNWLAPTSAVEVASSPGATSTASVRPGTPVVLYPQIGTTEIVVRTPSGEETTFATTDGQPMVYANTYELGIYAVEQRGGPSSGTGEAVHAHFAVNLFSELESTIEPRRSVAVGEYVVEAEQETVGRREWWHWPALAAFLLLVVEWVVYRRGSISGLRLLRTVGPFAEHPVAKRRGEDRQPSPSPSAFMTDCPGKDRQS